MDASADLLHTKSEPTVGFEPTTVLLQGSVGFGSGSHGGLPLTLIAGGVVPARFVACLLYVDVVGTAWNVVADKTVNDVVCHERGGRDAAIMYTFPKTNESLPGGVGDGCEQGREKISSHL
jgi:hypothetical protein